MDSPKLSPKSERVCSVSACAAAAIVDWLCVNKKSQMSRQNDGLETADWHFLQIQNEQTRQVIAAHGGFPLLTVMVFAQEMGELLA